MEAASGVRVGVRSGDVALGHQEKAPGPPPAEKVAAALLLVKLEATCAIEAEVGKVRKAMFDRAKAWAGIINDPAAPATGTAPAVILRATKLPVLSVSVPDIRNWAWAPVASNTAPSEPAT